MEYIKLRRGSMTGPRVVGILSNTGIILLYGALSMSWLMGQTPPKALNPDAWKTAPATTTGLEVGEKIPVFQLRDQNGKAQDFITIKGLNGAAIYFMRSADW